MYQLVEGLKVSGQQRRINDTVRRAPLWGMTKRMSHISARILDVTY
ncbi:MAG: hypothetical protein ACJ0RQ_15645 [Candidatus Azotimanducaceae bacterium]